MSSKTYKKKGKKTKPFTQAIAKQVATLVKESKTEEGFRNIASTIIAVQANGTQTHALAMLNQGLNDGERKTTEVLPISLRGTFVPRTDTSNVSNQMGRVIIVKSKENLNGALPVIGRMLVDPTVPWSLYTEDYSKEFQVLYDKRFLINRTSFDTTGISEQWCQPHDFNIKFASTTSSQVYSSSTSTSWLNNGIFMFVVGTQSSASQPASIDFTANFKYQS